MKEAEEARVMAAEEEDIHYSHIRRLFLGHMGNQTAQCDTHGQSGTQVTGCGDDDRDHTLLGAPDTGIAAVTLAAGGHAHQVVQPSPCGTARRKRTAVRRCAECVWNVMRRVA